MAIEVVPMQAALGAEIRGVDLGEKLPGGVVAEIRAAWLEHLVLLFRGQSLSDGQLLDFTSQLGAIEYPPSRQLNYSKGSGQKAEVPPEINVISNVKENGKPIGQLGAGEAVWHTDSAFFDVPPAGSVLHALEIPPTGGNTSFLNMYAALDTLPADLRGRIDGRRVKHDQTYTSTGDKRDDFDEVTDVRDAPGPYHPIIRTHPETGRPALYLGRRHNSYIEGCPVSESEETLDAIWAHTTMKKFVWEHAWRVGDVVIWDNRCTMHRRDAFDDGARRVMHRTQIKGDKPV